MLLTDLLAFGVVPGALIWLTQIAWIPFWAAGVINGVGHYFGYRSYDVADASTNIVPWGILIGGEELHNNHHAFASSAKLSSKWYELDIGWLYIRMLESFGLATVKKLAPQPRFARPKPAADFDTLHAVIANRYDVLLALRQVGAAHVRRGDAAASSAGRRATPRCCARSNAPCSAVRRPPARRARGSPRR
jgi:stearoyl-CoA desaturase (delta-9 desaturase)